MLIKKININIIMNYPESFEEVFTDINKLKTHLNQIVCLGVPASTTIKHIMEEYSISGIDLTNMFDREKLSARLIINDFIIYGDVMKNIIKNNDYKQFNIYWQQMKNNNLI